ncbi:hypothetical protein [Acetobacter vaccinii]|uniref:Uncharacterized protein n=1 Tax=Acetobacter vaccinii TaxID=2592655 RepID=A0A5C1YUG4_9PROT|nr:hypothetical protein [Acetobacter vaccinii]QEO18857.1 hypothetical protein FLP30_13390 [Acetobacter vaccinii]
MDLIDFRALNQTRRAAEGTEAATRAMQKSLAQMAQGTVPAATFTTIYNENNYLRELAQYWEENARIMKENRDQYSDWGDKQSAKAKRLQAELADALASFDSMKKHRDEWQAWGKKQQARADKLQAELNALRQAQAQAQAQGQTA